MEKEFGRLTIIGQIKLKGRTQQVCECTCGKITHVFLKNLRSGKVVSCGCYKKDFMHNWFEREKAYANNRGHRSRRQDDAGKEVSG
jgi:hypothetical protein